MNSHPYLDLLRADHLFTENCRKVMRGHMTAYENGTSAECFKFMRLLSEEAHRGFLREAESNVTSP